MAYAFGPTSRAAGTFGTAKEFRSWLEADALRRVEEAKFFAQIEAFEEQWKAELAGKKEMFYAGLEVTKKAALTAEEQWKAEFGLREKEFAEKVKEAEYIRKTWDRTFGLEEEKFELQKTLALTPEGVPRSTRPPTILEPMGVSEQEKFKWLTSFREEESVRMQEAISAGLALAAEKREQPKAAEEEEAAKKSKTSSVKSGKVRLPRGREDIYDPGAPEYV